MTHELLDTISESDVSLSFKVVDLKMSGGFDALSPVYEHKKVNNVQYTSEQFSPTSSEFMSTFMNKQQPKVKHNRKFSATSSAHQNLTNQTGSSSDAATKQRVQKDVERLMAMLDSTEPPSYNVKETIKKSNKAHGGTNTLSVADVKSFFNHLSQQGVKVNVSLDNKPFEEFFDENNTTTTTMKGGGIDDDSDDVDSLNKNYVGGKKHMKTSESSDGSSSVLGKKKRKLNDYMQVSQKVKEHLKKLFGKVDIIVSSKVAAEIIRNTKTSENEKIIASEFIPRAVKYIDTNKKYVESIIKEHTDKRKK